MKLKVDLAVAGGQQLEKSTVEYVQGAGTVLLGLVTVADAPGELPPPLAAMRRELDELYAQVWTVPHLPLLRLHGGGPVSVPELDTVVAQILSAALDHLNAAQEDSP